MRFYLRAFIYFKLFKALEKFERIKLMDMNIAVDTACRFLYVDFFAPHGVFKSTLTFKMSFDGRYLINKARDAFSCSRFEDFYAEACIVILECNGLSYKQVKRALIK